MNIKGGPNVRREVGCDDGTVIGANGHHRR